MHVLAIVGSTRAASTNRRLAETALAQLPEGSTGSISELPAHLPFYDEDVDSAGAPDAATRLRAEVGEADAVLLVTPEYNGGMSAVAKNAIDWLSRPFGDGIIKGKPVLVLGATMSARGAQWAREEAVKSVTIAGGLPLQRHLGVPSAFEAFDEDALREPVLHDDLRTLVGDLLAAAAERREPAGV